MKSVKFLNMTLRILLTVSIITALCVCSVGADKNQDYDDGEIIASVNAGDVTVYRPDVAPAGKREGNYSYSDIGVYLAEFCIVPDSKPVYDFEVVAIGFDENAGLRIERTLSKIGTVLPTESVNVKLSLACIYANRGISYKDEYGVVHVFGINADGRNGSLYAVQVKNDRTIRYSSLNLIDDISKPFETIQNKYGSIFTSYNIVGYTYVIFENNPLVTFCFFEGDERLCSEITTTADVLFDNFDDETELSVLEKSLSAQELSVVDCNRPKCVSWYVNSYDYRYILVELPYDTDFNSIRINPLDQVKILDAYCPGCMG